MLQVVIIGCGNWGTTIGKLLAENIKSDSPINQKIIVWIYDEIIEGKLLSEHINKKHINPKYLPGIKLPNNLVGVTSLSKATSMADILIFALPQHFVSNVVKQMESSVKPNARAISMMKGVIINKGNGLVLLSDLITRHLKIDCSVIMGANRAGEVANKIYGESTIGCKDPEFGILIKKIFQTDYLKLVITSDLVSVELMGALKNIVALAAGIIDGLGHGDNTKAAFIRLGYWEILAFMKSFYSKRGVNKLTSYQSCGFAEMFVCLAHNKQLMETPINLCYGSRNILVGMNLALTDKSLEQIEHDVLKGDIAHGPHTVAEVTSMLNACSQIDNYPIMNVLHQICQRKKPVSALIDAAVNHPAHY